MRNGEYDLLPLLRLEDQRPTSQRHKGSLLNAIKSFARLSAIVTVVLVTSTLILLMGGYGAQSRTSDFSPGAAQRSKSMFEQLSRRGNVTQTPSTENMAAVEKTTLQSEKEIKLQTKLKVVTESTQSSAQISDTTLVITTRTFEGSPSEQTAGKTISEDTAKVESSPSTQKIEMKTVAEYITVTNSHATESSTKPTAAKESPKETTAKESPKETTVKELPEETTAKEIQHTTEKSVKTVADNVTHSYYQTMQKLATTEKYFSKRFSYLHHTSIHKNVVPAKDFEISIKDINDVNDSRLINLTDFKYIINKEDFCPPDPETPFVIVVVHTAIDNLEKRNGIRQSWGLDVPVLFFMGATADAAAQRHVLEEDAQYHDLVQGSFMDTYHNLTYKHAMVLKWAVSFCPRVKYLVKIDDDGFLNVPYLMGTLHDLSGTGVLNLIGCMLFYSPGVMRYGKWEVSRQEYAPDTYPNYCNGWLIIYSPDVALRLYRESLEHKYFWIDDVHITGFLAKSLHIEQSQFSATIEGWGEDYGDPDKTHIIAGFPLAGKQMIKMTKHFNNHTSLVLNQIKLVQR